MRHSFFALMLTVFGFFACQNQPQNQQQSEQQPTTQKMTGLAGSLQDSIVIRVWPLEIDSLRRLDPNILMIDVRTELEYRTSHIYRSVSCDVDSPDFDKRILRLNPETPVIVYDNDGTRSLKAAEKMRQLGFKRVYELAGGVYSWARDGKVLIAGESGIDEITILK